jgi:hypothetical protein
MKNVPSGSSVLITPQLHPPSPVVVVLQSQVVVVEVVVEVHGGSGLKPFEHEVNVMSVGSSGQNVGHKQLHSPLSSSVVVVVGRRQGSAVVVVKVSEQCSGEQLSTLAQDAGHSPSTADWQLPVYGSQQ